MGKPELSVIHIKYAGKQTPKGQREGLAVAIVADDDCPLQKERKADEKEQAEEQTVKDGPK